MDWKEIRSEFLGLRSYAYLNTASQGLLPKRSIDAIKVYAEQKIFGSMYWGEWKYAMEEVRKLIAEIIGATEDEIGFVPSTSWGLNIVAHSIPWGEKDNIVITDMEFPANVFPWQVIAKKYNLEVRVVKNINGALRKEDFERVVDENTRVIAVSWVEFTNGFVNDLEFLSKLARKVGAYLIVDGIQGVGAIDIDIKKVGVDFLVSGFQKWLLGTGSAFLYIRKEVFDDIDIPFGGWLSSKTYSDFSFREFDPWDSVKRVEMGTPAFVDFLVAKESLSLLKQIGIKNIESRNRELKDALIKGLEELGVEINSKKDWRSSIILFKVSKSKELYERLISEGVIVSYRAGGIRVSPHFYNDKSDIERLLKVVSDFVK